MVLFACRRARCPASLRGAQNRFALDSREPSRLAYSPGLVGGVRSVVRAMSATPRPKALLVAEKPVSYGSRQRIDGRDFTVLRCQPKGWRALRNDRTVACLI